MSQPLPSGQPTPARIVSAQIAAMPSGDVAELVTDSRGDAWCHWLAKGPGTWTEWRRVAQKPGAVAIDGPFGTGVEAVLITAISGRGEPRPATGAPAPARRWFLLAASGFTEFSM